MKRSLALLLLVCSAAGAQPVYRCPDAGFSQAPCPGGERLPAPVQPSAAARAEAKDVAAGEARLADSLAAERRAREAQPARGAAGFHTAPAASAPAKVKKKQSSKPPSHRPEGV